MLLLFMLAPKDVMQYWWYVMQKDRKKISTELKSLISSLALSLMDASSTVSYDFYEDTLCAYLLSSAGKRKSVVSFVAHFSKSHFYQQLHKNIAM